MTLILIFMSLIIDGSTNYYIFFNNNTGESSGYKNLRNCRKRSRSLRRRRYKKGCPMYATDADKRNADTLINKRRRKKT